MSFNASRFVPFMYKSRQIGCLRPELAARLGAWPETFKSSAEKVVLLEPDELDPVIRKLAHEGFIPGWRNENYRIANLFDIEAPAEVMRYLVFKGSIAVDGISLTVAGVSKRNFRSWIIPHTYGVTALRERKVGDAVNLEADLLGKYVERFVTSRSTPD